MFPPISVKNISLSNVSRSQVFHQTPNQKTRATSKNSNGTPKAAQKNRIPLRSKSNQLVVKYQMDDDVQLCGKLSKLPYTCLRRIISYTIQGFEDVARLKKVCRKFFNILQTDQEVYFYAMPTHMRGCTAMEIHDALLGQTLDRMCNRYECFTKKTDQLFLYGATKMNLPDKLIDSCALSVNAKVNQKEFQPTLLTRKANFATHLYFKIPLDSVPCIMYESATPQTLKLKIDIISSYLKLQMNISRSYSSDFIHKNCIRQKAFNYFIDGGILITFFEGDSHPLYLIFEISAIEVIHYFKKRTNYNQLKTERARLQEKTSKAKLMIRAQLNQQQILKQKEEQKEDMENDDEIQLTFHQNNAFLPPNNTTNPARTLKTKPPLHNKTRIPVPKLVNYQYASLQYRYYQDQQDFEVFVNIHNGTKGQNLFLFMDTKSLPRICNNLLQFSIHLSELIETNSTQFYLDNRLGMRELVPDLYLGDIIIKDRDRFVLLYSGFVQASTIDHNILREYDVDDSLGYGRDEVTWKHLQVNLNHNSEFILIYVSEQKKTRARLLQINLSLQLIQQC